MKNYYLLLFFLVFLWSCEADPDTTPPEEVVQMYQAYIDQNKFDQAGQLSTLSEQKRLQELEQMIAADMEDTILKTVFERIDCQVQRDTAKCTCLLADQYESYTALFTLVKSNNDWVVDLPEEEEIEYDEELESMLDSLLQSQD